MEGLVRESVCTGRLFSLPLVTFEAERPVRRSGRGMSGFGRVRQRPGCDPDTAHCLADFLAARVSRGGTLVFGSRSIAVAALDVLVEMGTDLDGGRSGECGPMRAERALVWRRGSMFSVLL